MPPNPNRNKLTTHHDTGVDIYVAESGLFYTLDKNGDVYLKATSLDILIMKIREDARLQLDRPNMALNFTVIAKTNGQSTPVTVTGINGNTGAPRTKPTGLKVPTTWDYWIPVPLLTDQLVAVANKLHKASTEVADLRHQLATIAEPLRLKVRGIFTNYRQPIPEVVKREKLLAKKYHDLTNPEVK